MGWIAGGRRKTLEDCDLEDVGMKRDGLSNVGRNRPAKIQEINDTANTRKDLPTARMVSPIFVMLEIENS